MKQRTITAIILLAICIPLLLLGSYYLAVAVAIIGCMAGYELLSAHKKQQENSEKYPLLTVIFVFIGIISLVFLFSRRNHDKNWFFSRNFTFIFDIHVRQQCFFSKI